MSRKYLSIFLLMVVMICCVSAASATDVDNITVPDDTNIITDDIVESVDDVELDDSVSESDDVETNDDVSESDDVEITDANKIIGENNGPLRITPVNPTNYNTYFDVATGEYLGNAVPPLIFSGNFNNMLFKNFIINQSSIIIDATGATFKNVGFKFTAGNITLIGGTFTTTTTTKVNHVIDISAGDVEVTGVTMNLNAPKNKEFVAINVIGDTNAKILNNVITYTCNYVNKDVLNYVIRVKNSPNALIAGNNITAYLPLKEVAYYTGETDMDWDRVAVVGIENSNGFNLSYNNIDANVTCFDDSFPTLDSVIVLDSEDAYIGHNNVTEIDNVTQPGSANYLYAIDVYRCNHLNIDDNIIKLRSMGGTYINGTNNGTSTAYGIQLTGGHNVTIANNDIDTRNNGPNAGIYSQNYGGPTNLTIVNNTIYVEGNAGSHSWSLVTGMELQDNFGYIAGNKIKVYNKQGYVAGSNAYGISYSQWGMANPVFNITNNCVNLINGDYAVYIQSSDLTTYVTDNCLTSTNYVGDYAVYPATNVYISGNHNCTCTNCPVHP
ncbi:hypothetical protein [Methanobrevibacter sp.]|uniref:hypothetical protein n=1 Tax=Methanobrevibacter sp. TaxID=66852 RepID=UPI002E77A038|nr:hypothetical protein [Methanobrevibacter sp.]MEE1335747.1 hypothetical protein [Methanobrevibacter sp.]